MKIEMKNVTKEFAEGTIAVDSFNATFEDGKLTALLGPSGCGKSTLLNMIAGILDPTEGTIYIGDRDVTKIPMEKRGVSVVFQNYALYPHMTVYDNMAFGLKIRKVAKEEIDQRVREAAKLLDIEALLERKPKALSGGQRQRVAVGRAIVRNPKVFLFDEPLSNLDAKLRVQMRAEISGLHHRLQATMIYVTHDQVEALTMADKIVVMKLGVIQQIGGPMELYNEPDNKFVAGFIGSPPMNFIAMDVVKESGKTYVRTESFRLEVTPAQAAFLEPYVGKKVTFGIRPEDVEYSHQSQDGKTIDGNVSVVEPLGSETQVYVATDGANIVGKIDPSVVPTVGEPVALICNMEKARFFDIDTELRIR